MIKLIKQMLRFRRYLLGRDRCECKHGYVKCKRVINVTGNGVISVSGYAKCDRFMQKLKDQGAKAKEALYK